MYQEPQLFGELTVAENIYLGRELGRSGPRIDWAAQNEHVVDLLALLDLPASLSTKPVADLSIAQQQQISIAKALSGDARVLILDEPSAILTDTEIDVLFSVVRRLAESGVSIIYISHRLDELFRIADEVTVMRDGRTIGTYPIDEMSVRQIAELMVGGILDEDRPRERTVPEAAGRRLELVGLERTGEFHDVDLTVQPAVLGSAAWSAQVWPRSASTLYGVRRSRPGARSGSPAGRCAPPTRGRREKLGVALLPANRKQQGMFSFQPISFNISVGHLPLLSLAQGVWMDRTRERAWSPTR